MARNRLSRHFRQAECPDDRGDTNDVRARTAPRSLLDELLQTQRPPTVAEVIDPSRRYPGGVLRAMKCLRRSHAWRGSRDEQVAKFERLHQALCKTLGCDVALEFAPDYAREFVSSDASHYNPRRNAIVLKGRTSVVTYLHLLAIARGKGKWEACSWSINLFQRIFPKSFARCSHDGFILRKRPRS